MYHDAKLNLIHVHIINITLKAVVILVNFKYCVCKGHDLIIKPVHYTKTLKLTFDKNLAQVSITNIDESTKFLNNHIMPQYTSSHRSCGYFNLIISIINVLKLCNL